MPFGNRHVIHVFQSPCARFQVLIAVGYHCIVTLVITALFLCIALLLFITFLSRLCFRWILCIVTVPGSCIVFAPYLFFFTFLNYDCASNEPQLFLLYILLNGALCFFLLCLSATYTVFIVFNYLFLVTSWLVFAAFRTFFFIFVIINQGSRCSFFYFGTLICILTWLYSNEIWK